MKEPWKELRADIMDEAIYKFICKKCNYTIIVYGAKNQKEAERMHECQERK